MINNDMIYVYGPTDLAMDTERIEYDGYDAAVSTVRGRRRPGFRSRSVRNPWATVMHMSFSTDMAPVRSVPEWCAAADGQYSMNICSAVKEESMFICNHDDPGHYAYPKKVHAPVRYTHCLWCPLNNRKNYNLVTQSMFRELNNYINATSYINAAGETAPFRLICEVRNRKRQRGWRGQIIPKNMTE